MTTSVTTALTVGRIQDRPDFVDDARSSLASTLTSLAASGTHPYRKPPNSKQPEDCEMSAETDWNRYRRRGEVFAEKLPHEWTWTTTTGDLIARLRR